MANKKIKIKLNNVEKEFESKNPLKLKEVIEGAPYLENSNIAIIKGVKQEISESAMKYRIKTTGGAFILKVTEESPVVDFWNKNYKKFEDKNLRWKSVSDVAFGNITIDLDVNTESADFERWDVLLSISGLDKSEGHLVFMRKDNTEAYGLHNPKLGILIGGKRQLANLKPSDKIISIDLLRESKESVDYEVTTDLNTIIEDGWEIYTYCELNLKGPAKTTEHALSIFENGYIEVSQSSNTFISDSRLQTLKIDDLNTLPREKGTVTVRNTGVGMGKVYIYKESRTSSLSHTNVGKVVDGQELINFSTKGIVTTISKPERINLIGKSIKDALKILNEYDIELENKEDFSNSDVEKVIVEQTPNYTLDLLDAKKVTLKAVNPDNILHIKIYDKKAPKSAWYFRKLTGLTTKRIGILKTYFKHQDMAMFERNLEYAKALLPENTPKEKLDGNKIAITNMVKKYKGYAGIRTSSSDKYGPTGETFEGTNVVGEIVKNEGVLKSLKPKDEIYLYEEIE
ncbi:methyl-coenzyme M reductase-associated protein Mmp3 [Methanococcus voltae]|uniref:methyl-coenzyme M reductase-associated protein Mmp3 n=1 Tax=Methanococcus voltae TaxID=2188 RepID=UPI001AE60050|nr:methanogenesis marker 3 protein [Methanococcus voltae]MBP2172835.1 putative methanogenesis marker protein 3 [Methanococcus voltae]